MIRSAEQSDLILGSLPPKNPGSKSNGQSSALDERESKIGSVHIFSPSF